MERDTVPQSHEGKKPSPEEMALRLKLGARIRALRREQGISQERLAAVARLDRSYMGKVERGERDIGIDNVGKIARTLGVEVHELFLFMDAHAQAPTDEIERRTQP